MNQHEVDAGKYHRVMDLLRRMRLKHGTCEPRERKACTVCNAKEELDRMIDEYRGGRCGSGISVSEAEKQAVEIFAEGIKEYIDREIVGEVRA